MPPFRPEPDRFWEKVDKAGSSGGCWDWIAGIADTGYGIFRLAGRRHIGAHRWVWQHTNGAIPAGMVIDHRCHNRKCVNPDHLRVVSSVKNSENHSGATRASKSGIRGVYFDTRTQYWVAQYRDVSGGEKNSFFKRFPTKQEAADAILEHRLRVLTHNDIDRVA